MSWNPSMEVEDTLRIPPGVGTLEGFRRWSWSESFPEHGRIDFLDGELEIDLSPENLFKHGTPKTAIAAALHEQVAATGRGAVFVDATRVVSVDASISVEPDVVAVLWDSLASGRVRRVPVASGEPDSFIELEGAPDLVVEIVSESSVHKDRRRLPPLYARAGIPELWLVDARGPRGSDIELGIYHLRPTGYVLAPPDAEGWCDSRLLGRRCRLRRHVVGDLGSTYQLELG
ncbi:MAG TPA: Uma2 family endonuclease [Thermoanaerobaculia bacterium]|nr:Uma2 family endonuclease [Thermoanaerobaculia bacterium]